MVIVNNYHEYDSLLNVLVFTCNLILIIQLIYRAYKKLYNNMK